MCEQYEWCVVDHNDPIEESLDSPHVWHMDSDPQAGDVGVLRSDHVLDARGASLAVNEQFDWLIPDAEVPAFFTKLRASIDEAERRFEDFKTRVERV